MFPNNAYIDGLILESLRKDDEKALNYLFENYYNRLFRYGLKFEVPSLLVEECLQTVFWELWQYRHSLSDIQSFEAYLKIALKRRIFKTLSKEKKYSLSNESALVDKVLSVPSYEEILIQQQHNEHTKQQLTTFLEHLTPRQKEIVVLKYFEELSYAEISEQTSLQVDTIYKILHEAIKRLKGIDFALKY